MGFSMEGLEGGQVAVRSDEGREALAEGRASAKAWSGTFGFLPS